MTAPAAGAVVVALGPVPVLLLVVASVALGAAVTWSIGERRMAGLRRWTGDLDRALEAERAEVAASGRRLQQLETAFDAVPRGVAVYDRDGELFYRNLAAAPYLSGRHGDLLVGRAIDELVASALGGVAARRSVDLFGPPRRTVDVSTLPLGDDPVTGALVVVEDVSERIRLDSVRRDFVANISHELKTPVGALGLLAETLLDEDDPAVQRRLGTRMLAEAERVGRTIEDLLELSRIEAGELPARDPVPVHVVLAESVDRVLPAADLRGVSIELVEPGPALVVSGDRRQLTSAVYNLLENGVKYSDKGSSVWVSAEADGTDASVVVRDEGDGIPERDLERIFERFYRVDRARSRDTGGTGLGLAIVRHVAANHAGEVSVRSHEGEGSTFTLRLPLLAPPEEDRRP